MAVKRKPKKVKVWVTRDRLKGDDSVALWLDAPVRGEADEEPGGVFWEATGPGMYLCTLSVPIAKKLLGSFPPKGKVREAVLTFQEVKVKRHGKTSRPSR